MEKRNAVVVGAGIGGLSAAVALHQRGWEVTVLERARSLRPKGSGLGIGPNAVHALDAIGLGDAVRRLSAIQGHGGIRHSDGRWLIRTDLGVMKEKFGDPQLVVLRSDLTGILVSALPDGTVRTGVTVTGVDPGAPARRAVITTGDGQPHEADLVVGADGIRSAIRASIFPEHPGPEYSGFTTWRFLASASADADAGASAGPAQRPVEPAESWGDSEIFGAVRLADGRFYCYASAPEAPGVRHDDEAAELARRFSGWHDPIPALTGQLVADQVLHDDVYWLKTPLPRYHSGRVALLGDAAHAMTPHLGQGACMAIEDAVVLAGTSPDLAAYTSARLARTQMVVTASYRAARLSGLRRGPLASVRNAGLWTAGHFAKGLTIRQLAPIAGWMPPG